MKKEKIRNGLDDGFLTTLKDGIIKEKLDNGETYYWVITNDFEEVFGTLKEARNFYNYKELASL